YGPRDHGRVIPLFIENALCRRPLIVYGGSQILDLIHVDRVVDSLMRVGFGPHVPCPVNIGSGQGIPVLQLAERILKLTQSDSRISRVPSRPVEVTQFVADPAKARALLGLRDEDALARLPELIDSMARKASEIHKGAGRMAV